MLSRIATIFLVFVLSLGAPVYICATSPVAEESLLPEQEAIDNAARLPDPVARESALREAIRKGLLETRPEVATEVLGYLGEHSRWLDVRPFEDIITEFGRSNNPTSRNGGCGSIRRPSSMAARHSGTAGRCSARAQCCLPLTTGSLN